MRRIKPKPKLIRISGHMPILYDGQHSNILRDFLKEMSRRGMALTGWQKLSAPAPYYWPGGIYNLQVTGHGKTLGGFFAIGRECIRMGIHVKRMSDRPPESHYVYLVDIALTCTYKSVVDVDVLIDYCMGLIKK